MKRRKFSPEYLRHIHSDKWKLFRMRIIAKRGRRCQDCTKTRGPIDLHHLTYERLGHEREADVRLLCRKCHDKRHGR